jgi:hypothetical protein
LPFFYLYAGDDKDWKLAPQEHGPNAYRCADSVGSRHRWELNPSTFIIAPFHVQTETEPMPDRCGLKNKLGQWTVQKLSELSQAHERNIQA